MLSMRAIQRPGPASLPMSSRFRRPSAAHGGTGTGVAVGGGGAVRGPVGMTPGLAVGRGAKLAAGISNPLLGSTKIAVAASFALDAHQLDRPVERQDAGERDDEQRIATGAAARR